MKTDILFFTRGRGRGHAVRDLAIAQQLRNINPDLNLAFASYDLGYEVLAEADENVHDLLLEERNPFPATVVRATQLVKYLEPRLVVAQEEPAALVAAANCNIRSIFTTSWFPRSTKEKYQALEYAHCILFMEMPGLFPVHPTLADRILYCGPVLRPMNLDPTAASAVRSDLGLSPDHTLITVLPGSPSEAREPIFDLVLSAFKSMKSSPRRLVWLAGRDYECLSKRAALCSDVLILGTTRQMDGLILASQAVVTKGTYNITRELMALGRPSISLSHKHNWVDDFYASQWPNNVALTVEDTNSESLALRIEFLLQVLGKLETSPELTAGSGARRAAEIIIAEL